MSAERQLWRHFGFKMSNLTFHLLNNKLVHSSNNPWFKAKDVSKPLNYQNTKQAVSVNVDEEDKCNTCNTCKYNQL